MGNKNESIFLWMLEQERQKNRTQVLEEKESDLVELSTTADQPPESEKPHKKEDKPATPKETPDLERLMKEKESLELESRRLDEEQEKLNLRVKALCEKIIQQTKKNNSEKSQAANQLQVRIDSLEAQLNALLGSGTQEEQGCIAQNPL